VNPILPKKWSGVGAKGSAVLDWWLKTDAESVRFVECACDFLHLFFVIKILTIGRYKAFSACMPAVDKMQACVSSGCIDRSFFPVFLCGYLSLSRRHKFAT
jgi:hypothetical protein